MRIVVDGGKTRLHSILQRRHCNISHLTYFHLVWPRHSPLRGLMGLGRHVALLTKAEGRSDAMWPYEAGSQTAMAASTSLPPGALAHHTGNSAAAPMLWRNPSHTGRSCVRTQLDSCWLSWILAVWGTLAEAMGVMQRQASFIVLFLSKFLSCGVQEPDKIVVLYTLSFGVVTETTAL